MTKCSPKPGDIVNFKNPSLGTSHRGVVVEYRPGRSVNAGTERDVLVKFNIPIWDGGPLEAWCSIEDLTIIWPTLRKAYEVKPTVTYTSSSTTTSTDYGNYNIQIQKDNKVAQSTVSFADKPWTQYYVTADEFFEILRVAFDDTYGGGSDTPWHPEDMYINVVTTLEVVTNTLANMANLKANRPVKGIKEI
jgi:hypothetical protein